MKNAQFRYMLRVGTVRREVNPVGVKDGKITGAPEGDNLFFRRKYSGGLTFQNADFDLLRQAEQSAIRCNECQLDIERECGGQYVNLWSGAFSLTDVKYQYDLGTAKVDTFIVNDAYRAILDGWAKEHNVLNVATTYSVSAKLDFRTNFEFEYYDLDNGIDSLDYSDTYSTFLEAPYWVDGSFPQGGTRSKMNIAFRLVRTAPYTVNAQFPNGIVADLSSDGWKVVFDDPANKVAKYAKQPNLYNFSPYRWGTKGEWSKYPDLVQVNCNSAYDTSLYIKVNKVADSLHSAECRNGFNGPKNGCINIRYYVDETRCRDILWKYGTFNFTRNRRLVDVIYYLLQQVSPANCPASADDLSQFFTAPINYVTGAANKLKNILIAQKTDIISYKSSEAASKGLYSLKNLLEDLRNIFNVYWYIDANGKFKIEHLSFFGSVGTFDLTTNDYERWVRGTRGFEFDKTKMPKYEKLKFSEGNTDDFLTSVIEYSGACVNSREGEDSKETVISRITTDIQGLMINAGSVGNDGFVLLVHDGQNILQETGQMTGGILANGHLAAANLHAAYFLHGRVLSSGKINGYNYTFKSIIKTKKQEPISFPYCCEDSINAFSTFVTTLGANGQLGSNELTIKDGVMKVNVLHGSEPDHVGPTPGRQFNPSFNPSFS